MNFHSPVPAPHSTSQAETRFILEECRNLFVCRLGEIAQRSGITHAQFLETMRRDAAEAHDELAAEAPPDGFDQTHGLTASRISLLGHDDLEIDIRIGDIASHLRDDQRIDHWRVQLRYMNLLQRPTMPPELNPLGMEPIRRALWAICRAGGGSLEEQFSRLDNLEETLKLRLPGVYAELNQQLENRGIQPLQQQRVRPPLARSAAQINPLATLQLAMQQQRGNAFPLGSAAPGGGGIAGPEGNALLDASAMVMLNHLIERMNAIELRHAAGVTFPDVATEADASPQKLFRSKDFDLAPGQPVAIMLDTLALLFEAIYASPDLPDVVKSLLGRLQIPLLKHAMLDAGFFANDQHAARTLINRLADAALGLPADAPRDHPLCGHFARIVDAAREVLGQGKGDLAPLIARLDAIVGKRDEAIRKATRPLVEQVLRHERKEDAQASAEDWLARTRPAVTAPAVADFLSTHWVEVMAVACEEDGRYGDAWRDAEAAIEYLLWSIRPKQTPEDRQKLTAGIPALLKRINAGLDRIALPHEARKPFLDACFALQTAALRARATDEAPVAAPPQAPERAKRTMQPSLLEADGCRVHYHGNPAARTSPWLTGASAVKPGDWLNYTLPDGKRLSGTCCWQDPQTRTVLLFSPATRHALAMPQEAIEAQLRAGQARMLSGTALFDAAAQRALRQLRGG